MIKLCIVRRNKMLVAVGFWCWRILCNMMNSSCYFTLTFASSCIIFTLVLSFLANFFLQMVSNKTFLGETGCPVQCIHIHVNLRQRFFSGDKGSMQLWIKKIHWSLQSDITVDGLIFKQFSKIVHLRIYAQNSGPLIWKFSI